MWKTEKWGVILMEKNFEKVEKRNFVKKENFNKV